VVNQQTSLCQSGSLSIAHGIYYDNYCYLPLYIFCGRHLIAAKLRRANIDGAAGAVRRRGRADRWPDPPKLASHPDCCAPIPASAARR